MKVGSSEGFAPWLDQNESSIDNKEIKPASYDEAMEYEQASCGMLKDVVQGNKLMKRVKEAADGNIFRILYKPSILSIFF